MCLIDPYTFFEELIKKLTQKVFSYSCQVVFHCGDNLVGGNWISTLEINPQDHYKD